MRNSTYTKHKVIELVFIVGILVIPNYYLKN